MCVCMYYSPHTIQVYFIFFIQCSLVFPLLGHDFIHVYKIIPYILAEVLQSEGNHEMEFDGVYQIMVFTLYCSVYWKCPKHGKIALCFVSLVLQFSAFCILIPIFEVKSH